MWFFYDSYYWILVVPALLISLWASFKCKSTFQRYSQMPAPMTGYDASRLIQQRYGIQVNMGHVPGSMTDHYDPRNNTIRRSDPVDGAATVAAMGVAAHETGHALQYAEGYFPIKVRSAILPTTQFASTLAPWLFLAGLLLGIGELAYLGIAFFGLAVLFQLLTLPVEFDASRRALAALSESGTMTEQQLAGVRDVLTAAALTYVAALLVSMMSLLRMILLVNRRNSR